MRAKYKKQLNSFLCISKLYKKQWWAALYDYAAQYATPYVKKACFELGCLLCIIFTIQFYVWLGEAILNPFIFSSSGMSVIINSSKLPNWLLWLDDARQIKTRQEWKLLSYPFPIGLRVKVTVVVVWLLSLKLHVLTVHTRMVVLCAVCNSN